MSDANKNPKTGHQVIHSYLKTIDGSPGVYRMLDSESRVLYVGKARNLRARVSNYARPSGHSGRIARMISNTASMMFLTTKTETEALLLEHNYIKPYPICRWAHAALDALSGLMRDHGFSAGDVTRIEVNTFSEAAALFPGMPATTSQAQYSLPFALAVMLVHGRIGPGHISGTALNDPKVAEVLALIAVREEDRHSNCFPGGRWSDLTVTLKDGTRLASGDVHARGGPEAPMDQSEIEAKFRVMTAALPEPRVTALWEMRERLLQPKAKFSELAQLVRAPVEENHV